MSNFPVSLPFIISFQFVVSLSYGIYLIGKLLSRSFTHVSFTFPLLLNFFFLLVRLRISNVFFLMLDPGVNLYRGPFQIFVVPIFYRLFKDSLLF